MHSIYRQENRRKVGGLEEGREEKEEEKEEKDGGREEGEKQGEMGKRKLPLPQAPQILDRHAHPKSGISLVSAKADGYD